MGRPVIVVDYDPAWPGQFEELRQALAGGLGDVAQRIEHVGSTSVPGLTAKPILDIDIVIESRAILPAAIERLAMLGYEHQGDLDVDGREAFRSRGAPTVHPPRTWPAHHLYVCARDNRELRRHLTFRDWLRSHDEDATSYGRLKRELARRFPNDMDEYCEAKTDFVEGILARAHKQGSTRGSE
jgi:GrpB-like predicted nucleotidyltransferase (UPF0157 family)